MTAHVVIPTRFDRPSLWPLIDTARQVATVVIVHTEPGHADVPDAINVHDYRRNISAWWNTGLDACDGRALVLNDDVEATPEALGALLTALQTADLVYVPGRNKKARTRISGWCWGIDSRAALRPSTVYHWWYGEDDLYSRAHEAGWRIECVDVDVRHIDRGGFGVAPEFAEAVKADRAMYEDRWGRR